eukprot:NODE_15_length_50561_cov_0.608081.p14 type:complete len:394 gc:universal NODE_15_length_50561_cov_0.608081:19461-18280(-)
MESHNGPLQSKRSVYAWYLYDFANTVYATVAMTFFLPLIVESLSDDSTAMYINSFSVFMQALFCISSGGLADYGGNKKAILVFTTWIGGLSCILIGLSRNIQFIAVFIVLSNVAYGVSLVVYNAYLPFIVREHIAEIQTRETNLDEISSPVSLLDEDHISSQFSSYGFAWGYVGGVLCLIIAATINMFTGPIYGKQLSLILTGIWWLGFGSLAFVNLKSYPGEPLPPTMQRKIGGSTADLSLVRKLTRKIYVTYVYVAFSWERLYISVKNCRKIPTTFYFLLAFALYADAAQTMTTVAILFARSELGVPDKHLLINAILIPFIAGIGNVFWLRLQKFMNWSSKKTLLIVLSIVLLVPIYAVLGKWSKTFFLHQVWEIYPVCIIFGFTLGNFYL